MALGVAMSKVPAASTDSAQPDILAAPLHVGWVDLHPDVGMNFQLNRWLAYGGQSWLADGRPVLANLQGFDAWRDNFVVLGERAESDGRMLDAALHLRAAGFFMVPADPRKTPTRRRLTAMLREAYGVTPADRREVRFAGATLPVFRFTADEPRGTILAFGGFDSYRSATCRSRLQ